MTENSIDEELRAIAQDGAISCARALGFASEKGVTPAEVGARMDALNLKVHNCQLGCFGEGKKKKDR
jgi:hypothetical protein